MKDFFGHLSDAQAKLVPKPSQIYQLTPPVCRGDLGARCVTMAKTHCLAEQCATYLLTCLFMQCPHISQAVPVEMSASVDD